MASVLCASPAARAARTPEGPTARPDSLSSNASRAAALCAERPGKVRAARRPVPVGGPARGRRRDALRPASGMTSTASVTASQRSEVLRCSTLDGSTMFVSEWPCGSPSSAPPSAAWAFSLRLWCASVAESPQPRRAEPSLRAPRRQLPRSPHCPNPPRGLDASGGWLIHQDLMGRSSARSSFWVTCCSPRAHPGSRGGDLDERYGIDWELAGPASVLEDTLIRGLVPWEGGVSALGASDHSTMSPHLWS